MAGRGASAVDADLVEELKSQGNRLLTSGQPAAAELVYSEALKHAPGAHALLANRSLARVRLGRLADALADARACVEAAPRWSKAHARLGAALAAAGKQTEAAAAYERAAEVAGTHERDTSAADEYEAAALLAKREAMRRAGGGAARDGGF